VPPGLGNFSPGHDRANRWVLPALHRPPRNPPRSPCFPHLSWAHSLVGPSFRGANASTARHSSPNTHPEEFTPTVLLTMADHPLLAGKPQALRSMISSTREAVGDLKRGPSRSRGTRSTSCIRLSSYPQCQQFSVWRDVRTGPKPIHRGPPCVAACGETRTLGEGLSNQERPAPPPRNASASPGRRCAPSRLGGGAGRPGALSGTPGPRTTRGDRSVP
jgi:hypothetical protein